MGERREWSSPFILVPRRAALHRKLPGSERSGGMNNEAGLRRERAEFFQRPIFTAHQYEHQKFRRSSFFWCHTIEDHHAPGRTGRFGAAAEQGASSRVRPISEYMFQKIKIFSGREGIEKALAAGGNAVADARSSKQRRRARNGSRQIYQRAMQMRVGAQHLGEQRAGAASDVDYCADRGPIRGIEQHARVGAP
jgi:hypothetical protein